MLSSTLFRVLLMFGLLVGYATSSKQHQTYDIAGLIRLRQEYGRPFSPEASKHLLRLAKEGNTKAMDSFLEQERLLTIHINPEARVKAAKGIARPILSLSGTSEFLIRIENEAGVTAPLQVQILGTDRKDDSKSLNPKIWTISGDAKLSGADVEYAILSLKASPEVRKAWEAILTFDVGQGTQDLGFRSEIPLLFRRETLGNSTKPPLWDTFSDTWVATDEIGRTLPDFSVAGAARKERTVGLFYFLWHGAHTNGGPYDITKILKTNPDAMQQADSPLWGPVGAPHHWGESLFGYYLSDDVYVYRKHAQMLADAGVDVIIFDLTNQFTYKHEYLTLLKTFAEVRANGGKTPQIAFLCPFWEPSKVVFELYRDLYAPGHYRDLWFQWEGKPFILADPNLLHSSEGVTLQNVAAPLEAGQTLGQSFTISKPMSAIGGRFPTWSTHNAKFTLTLYKDKPGGEPIAMKRYENVADNAWLLLSLPKPIPAGTYYLEASGAEGKIGWWSHKENVYPQGNGFVNGKPVDSDRTLQFIYSGGEDLEVRNFFTFRKPQADYFQGPTAPNMWSWLEVYPQHVYKNAKGEKEQMAVGVAQNAIGTRLGTLSEPGAKGRNYHQGLLDTRPDAVLLGLNFQEQWNRALQEDPKFIFITGWNEWYAGRFTEFLGVKLPVMFVDSFNQEFSRDIEPMRGGHGDNYYYQMIANIRRYKGVRPPPKASQPKTIRITDSFTQWYNVRPEFRDDIGDTLHRNHAGYNRHTQYVNQTGRNDIILSKVARDKDFLYFYVRTRTQLSPKTDPQWMQLLLNTDGNHKTGWYGYDMVLNRVKPNSTTAVLESWSGSAGWKPKARVRYHSEGNELMLAIPQNALGWKPVARAILDFKWADNIDLRATEGMLVFITNGDTAPNSRFNYRVSF